MLGQDGQGDRPEGLCLSGARENGDDLCRETVEGWPKQKQCSCKGAKARGGEAAEGHDVVLRLEGLSHTGILAGEKVGEEEWIPAGGSRQAALGGGTLSSQGWEMACKQDHTPWRGHCGGSVGWIGGG